MSDDAYDAIARGATDCALCRRSVLVGEPLTPFHDPRNAIDQIVCDLCGGRARTRGWTQSGEPRRRAGNTRLRVEHAGAVAASGLRLAPEQPAPLTAPQAAVLERAIGLETTPVNPEPPSELLSRVRSQDVELSRLRAELNPARRAEERRVAERQLAELRELRAMLQEREQRIEQLQRARHAETSPMRMSGFALSSFNQSKELERMARIARTLGDPTINVHDEGPGIPRRVRLTLSWDIAWYEFTIKLDLGAGRASVHETGTGGDPAILPLERRRANATWSDSGLKLS